MTRPAILANTLARCHRVGCWCDDCAEVTRPIPYERIAQLLPPVPAWHPPLAVPEPLHAGPRASCPTEPLTTIKESI